MGKVHFHQHEVFGGVLLERAGIEYFGVDLLALVSHQSEPGVSQQNVFVLRLGQSKGLAIVLRPGRRSTAAAFERKASTRHETRANDFMADRGYFPVRP